MFAKAINFLEKLRKLLFSSRSSPKNLFGSSGEAFTICGRNDHRKNDSRVSLARVMCTHVTICASRWETAKGRSFPLFAASLREIFSDTKFHSTREIANHL